MPRMLKNKLFWICLPFLATAAFLASNDFARRMAIYGPTMGAGVAAKLACSGVYLMDRNPEEVIKRDMDPFYDPLMKLVSFEFDKEHQTAKATMLGMFTQTALYRPGVGCTLMQGVSRNDLLVQSEGIQEYERTHREDQWPYGDVVAQNQNPDIDWLQLEKGIEGAFEDNTELKSIDTRAVIVVYDGEIVAEKYADGFGPNSRFLSWSASKSMTSALIGTMVTDGKLALHEPAPVPEWSSPDDPRSDISLHHLVTMTSGLAFSEPYIPGNDSTEMLFHQPRMAGFAASKPLAHSPGTEWYYSSGTTNLLSRILFEKAGGSLRAVHDYSWRRFFEPVGMTSAVFEPDTSGSFVGSSYFYASARDWARFGLLFLNDGKVGDRQILSKEWVEYSRTPTPLAPQGQYGAQFWLNAGHPTKDEGHMMPNCPKDMYMALGYNDQWVAIVPSKKAVVIRLGWTTNDAWFDGDLHFSEILKALPDVHSDVDKEVTVASTD